MIDFDTLLLAPAHGIFGEAVQYLPAAGGAVAMAGIFSDRYQEIKYQDGVEIIDVHPVLTVRAARFSAVPVQYDGFLIRNITYTVTAVEPDGMGEIKFILRANTDADAAAMQGAPREFSDDFSKDFA